MRLTTQPVRFIVLFSVVACGNCDSDAEEPTTETPTVGESGSLLDTDGTLAQGGTLGVDFDVPVEAGANLTIQVTASDFDPVVSVRPPGSGVLTNDDYQGSRTESRVSVVAAEAGVMKVIVTSFQPDASGAFHVRVTTLANAAEGATPLSSSTVVPVGGEHSGELGPGDPTLADGRFHESLVLAGADAGPLELRIVAATQASIPSAIVMDPHGRTLSPAGGGQYNIVEPGPHRLQLLAPSPGATAGYSLTLRAAQANVAGEAPTTPTLARGHHQLPTTPGTQTLTLGQVVQGALADSTPQLPTGERADVYTMMGTTGQPLHAALESSDFDTYLMVIGPSGRHWENDDSGGGTDSTIDLVLPADGAYRIVATAYRAGETGQYALKTGVGQTAAPAQVNVAAQPQGPAATGREITGTLQQGDATLQSGEFADTHELRFAAGERVHLALHSDAFDSYLIVKPPTGNQMDNDDASSNDRDAALDFVAESAGTYRVVVTSYQPGETGSYSLRVGGTGSATPPAPVPVPTNPASTPPVAAVGPSVTGTLAAGDAQLSDGEYTDVLTRTFTAGEPVNISLQSTSFDPYLIIVSPSGHQLDNDDLNANTRDAGIRIPSAEAGEYRITVTSYAARETGPYTLSFEAGTPVPRANSAAGSPRVFGLFAGISDYPDGVGDLPECANDAVKLAEALRNRGLLDPSRQVLLTDAQATRANVSAALRRFAGEMGPQDVFVFFYSGHGGQTSSSTDPREIDGTDEYLVLHDGQLMDNDLAQQFAAVQAGTSVIAIDACFSGGFAKDMITQPGRVGLFSSEEDVLSAVAGQFQAGGYLSHFLRTAVQGEADASPRDNVLTVGELTHFLYTQFGTHATDVQLQGAYQHLVVDRGAVHVDQVLWSYQ